MTTRQVTPGLHPYTAALVRQNMRGRQIAGFPTASTTGGKIAEGVGLGAVAGGLAGAAVGAAMGKVGMAAAIGAGGGALVGGIIGARSGAAASPASLEQLNVATGTNGTVSLAVSSSGGGFTQATFSAPSGGGAVTLSSSDPTIVSVWGNGATAVAVGTANLTASWVDSSGTNQAGTIP